MQGRPARRAGALVTTLVVGLLVGGCILSGQSGLPSTAPLPPEVPRASAARPTLDKQQQQLVARFGGPYDAPAAVALVGSVVDRLVRASETPVQSYKVTILNSPTINAFALPTGQIYVTRGLLALANDTAELAAVLAHEIGHVTAKHALVRAEYQRRADLLSRVSEQVLNDPQGAQTLRSNSLLTLAGFSRLQELEADLISVRTIARAGFDPFGATRFLVSLGRNAAQKGGSEPRSSMRPDFLATHPTTPERVARALLAARQIGAPGAGESDRERYLRSIDGIAFGEDPADGFVRGRRYLHPELKIAFTAPESFALESSAQSVIGVGGASGQALRFDAVKLAGEQSLADYLKSGLLQQGTVSDIRTTDLNGFTAATGVVRGEDWTYRVAVIRAGQSSYRFIFAAQQDGAAAERDFADTIASFRRLQGDEARALRQTRIEIVTARAGDTAETLAERMADVLDRPLERFLLLNGLDKASPVKLGERYKVIRD